MNTFHNPLTAAQTSRFAALALHCVRHEFPYQPAHIIADERDLHRPRILHPAFYGCFDWHSAVHGHWLLTRVLRRFPDLPEAQTIRATLNFNLSEENLLAEAAYFESANHRGFERTYGWAWLLKLMQETAAWQDPDSQRWARYLQPLVQIIEGRYLDFLPKQTYPIRTGTHANTAFGLAFAFDYTQAADHATLRDMVQQRSQDYFGADRLAPVAWEPNGNDFLSPVLMEADLMHRVMPAPAFSDWLAGFWPGLSEGNLAPLHQPALVADRTDGQLVHLDGLNLSRAWCMWNIGAALPTSDPRRPLLFEAATRHAEVGLAHVMSGDYMGEHWLASFALYMLECAEIAQRV
jgi:hypothetical protein